MSEPTIRVESCRGDGRCPECKRSMGDRRGQLALLPLLPCGCYCCAKCALDHARALLTEALRQLSERPEAGWLSKNLEALREERDTAIRERDEARERAQALTAAMAWMKSPMESCMAERADGDGGCGSCALCCKEACERAEKAEALLRECLVVLDPWAWDLLVARIREALPK